MESAGEGGLDLRLTKQLAARFADIALGHVEREYPHKLDHVLGGPEDARTPSDLHPVFHGSFDWHSCVHGHWLLARLLRRYPGLPQAAAIRALFDRQFTPSKVASEMAYLNRPASAGFERPYGWAWLMKLQAELQDLGDEGAAWADALGPLAKAFAERMRGYLGKLTYPVRSGAHANSAFALWLAFDYAVAAGDDPLKDSIETRAWEWFGRDAACQAWEPSGEDFLSPALMEAECLRRILPAATFAAWFAAFLPELGEGQPGALFEPAEVSDRTDGKIAHLDGLNFSRAWCWRALAGSCPEGHRRRMQSAANRHLEASLGAIAGDYMGEHWLASFALLALEA